MTSAIISLNLEWWEILTVILVDVLLKKVLFIEDAYIYGSGHGGVAVLLPGFVICR